MTENVKNAVIAKACTDWGFSSRRNGNFYITTITRRIHPQMLELTATDYLAAFQWVTANPDPDQLPQEQLAQPDLSFDVF